MRCLERHTEDLRELLRLQVQASPDKSQYDELCCCVDFLKTLTPMQMPYSARTARKGLSDLQKPEASSRMMKRKRLATMRNLRPYL